MRQMDRPLVIKTLDNNKQTFYTHFDHHSNVLWVVNKGSNYTNIFHLDDNDGSYTMTTLEKYNCKSSQLSYYFMQKRFSDYTKNEI